MEKNVKVVDTRGLDETTISKIESVMIYTNDYYENDTLFVELHNSKGEVIRIFPERIQEICSNKLSYPFEIGEDYYTIENGQVIHSCWDDVSEEMYTPETKYFATEEEANNFIKQNLKPIN